MGPGHTGTSPQILPDCLSLRTFGLLRQHADGRHWRSQVNASHVEFDLAGECPQEGRFSNAVGPDQANAVTRRKREVDGIENKLRTPTDGKRSGDE